MNNPKIFISASAIMIFLVGGVLVFSYFQTPSLEPEPAGSLGGNPFGGGPITSFPQGGSQGTTNPANTYKLPLFVGGELSVRDLTKDTDVLLVEAPGVSENIYSLGSLPTTTYHIVGTPNSELMDPVERGYEMLYFVDQGTITATILKEPVSDLRKTLTRDLAERLGVQASSLCNAYVDVYIDPSANTFYAGKNVGLFGCPESTKLPGD